MESSVIRLVPKKPRPEISFDEWDGLLRIAFVRKNRTMRASFLGTTAVLDLLEGNYRTWCAQNNVPVDDSPVEDATAAEADVDIKMIDNEDNDDEGNKEDEWGGFMDVDDASTQAQSALPETAKIKGGKRKRKGKVADLIRAKLRKVLEDKTGLADRRARQCDEGDFLRLLWAMNEEGIHFR